MRNRTAYGVLFALITALVSIAPVLAQFYVNPYSNPNYNNYGYRGYTPYNSYGYNHTARNVAVGTAIGSAVGAAVGLLASHHGHRSW
jgi:hypothetical protein